MADLKTTAERRDRFRAWMRDPGRSLDQLSGPHALVEVARLAELEPVP